MLGCMLGTLLLALFNVVNVQGVYMDEAFLTDWHLANIGQYNCVFESAKNDKFIVLSDYDNSTMLTYVNEITGQPLSRQTMSYKVVDVLQDEDNKYYFKNDQNHLILFEEDVGLDYTVTVEDESSLRSVCTPDLRNIKVSENKIEVIDSESNLKLMSAELPHNFTELIFAETDGIETLKVLFVTEKLHYMFQSFENGNVTTSWERDESLTNVVAHTYVTIPDLSLIAATNEFFNENKFSNPLSAYIYRITTNGRRLVSFLKKNRLSPGKLLTNLLFSDEVEGSEVVKSIKDFRFGFSKLLLVGTIAGQVSAIDIKSGVVQWSITPLNDEIKIIDWNEAKREFLIIYEDGHYFRYSLGDYKHLTLKMKKKLDSSIDTVHSLRGSHSYYITYKNGQKHILDIYNEINDNNKASIFIADHNKKGIFGLMQNSNDELVKTWSINLKENEELVAFTNKEPEPISNIAVVLGNRTVLYKYLYPNLASYAVVDKKTRSLYINIIESVTGSILYTQYHDDIVNSELPINLVFGEHWVIYSYFSSQPVPEQKISVIELYDSLTPNERVSDPNKTYNPLNGIYKPAVINKSYLFQDVIKSLQLTKTKFSVTTKAILIETQSGQMTYVLKYIISARRKDENLLTDDDKKEFISTPYSSIIPLNDQFYLTHSRQLYMGVRSKISSIATNLESNSIVCNLGHDIFCTKVYPSLQFDVMSPSFERGKLLITIAIMSIILYFLRPRMVMKQIKSTWMVRD